MGNWFSKLFGGNKTRYSKPDNNKTLNSEMKTETPVAPTMDNNVEPEPVSEFEEKVSSDVLPEDEVVTEPQVDENDEVDEMGNKDWK